MMVVRREVLAGLGMLGLGGAAAAQESGVAVPMRSSLGRPWTTGVMDDARDLRMLFSTQAQLFRAEKATVEAANLHPLPMRAGDQPLHRAALLGLGGAYGFRQLEVVEQPARRTAPLFHVHVPVLQDAPSLYDFAGGRFVIGWDAASAQDFAGVAMPSTGGGREAWMRLPAVDVELDGMPLRLQINTASPYGVTLDPEAVDRLGLWDRWEGGYERVAAGEPAAEDGWAVRVRRAGRLKVLDWTLDGPIVGLRGPRDARRRVAGIDGFLGLDVLGRFAMGFEPEGWRLRLRRNTGSDAPFRHDRSGLQLAWREGAYAVVAVDPGSPAQAAGARVGDIADGLDAVGAESFEWAASDPAGGAVDLSLLRDGRPLALRIPLIDRL